MKTSSKRITSTLRATSVLGGIALALALTFASAQQSAAARDRAVVDAVLVEAVLVEAVLLEDAVPLQRGSCGDNRCDPPEDCNTCERDCGDCCGDNRCAPPEDCNSCERDCGRC